MICQSRTRKGTGDRPTRRHVRRVAAPSSGSSSRWGSARCWSERAAALLAPLLNAASLTGQPIEAVLRWVLSREVEPARLALLDTDAEIAAHVLDGIERTDSRERSSIFSAAAGVLAAYNSDAVRRAAANPHFDPGHFAASTDTIYITAPEHRQALCAPLIVGLLEQIRHAVYERSAREEGKGPPMLWALDELANIAPIHDLPALISQAGGRDCRLWSACRT
jgi:type IV secretion system protein VirD4